MTITGIESVIGALMMASGLIAIFFILRYIEHEINKRTSDKDRINEMNKKINDLNKMRDYFNSIDDEERAEIIKIVKAETAREYRETIKGDVYAWAYIISNMSK